jgi:CheY-like chemotaxis protein
VDDEDDARALFLATLQARGASVVTSDSVARALQVFEDFRPDVLVADIGMPGEDGYSLIRKVRSLPEELGGAVPAVAVTAYARQKDRSAALAAGFERHLSKPFDPEELVATIVSLTAARSVDRS